MIIRDIMSKNLEISSPDDTLHEVAQKMQRHDCGCILIVKDDRLLGMITDRDIAVRCVAAEHDPVGTTAKDIMSHEILYCTDTDGADDVTRKMGENKVRRLPVLDAEKRLVGIVTLGDLASHSNHELCGKTLGDICRSEARIAA